MNMCWLNYFIDRRVSWSELEKVRFLPHSDTNESMTIFKRYIVYNSLYCCQTNDPKTFEVVNLLLILIKDLDLVPNVVYQLFSDICLKSVLRNKLELQPLMFHIVFD